MDQAFAPAPSAQRNFSFAAASGWIGGSACLSSKAHDIPFPRTPVAHPTVTDQRPFPLASNSQGAVMTAPFHSCLYCPLERAPERLVIEGLRLWMAGYETLDVACWDQAWTLFAKELGGREGRRAFGEFIHWAKTLRTVSPSGLNVFPCRCRRLSVDEFHAAAMIAALHNNAPKQARASAYALAGPGGLNAANEAATSFADVLQELNQRLMPFPESVDLGDAPHMAKALSAQHH